jgi:NADPH2:quinone reductase
MRAIVVKEPGTGGNIEVTEAPEPHPGSGEVCIEVAYAGCNFADTMVAKGVYPHPKGYPLVMGFEPSGRIVEIGRGVQGFAMGDRVAAFSENAGAFAERIVVPAERLLRIPESMPLDVAAAFPIQTLTAWHLLHNVSVTKPGDVILLHAIGGGVGLMATQIAVAAGAVVIGTVGTRGKEKRALEFGAVEVINREDTDFVAVALAFTGDRGVDKVVDSTGASILDRSFGAIRKLGHVVSYGEAEGRPFPTLWERLVVKSLTFTRFHLGHVDFGSEIWRRSVDEVISAIGARRLKVPVEEVFAFDRAEAMLDRLSSRAVAGKLLLAVKPE